MSKILATKYHTQINNEILPYASCGVTCMAMILNWLNDKFGTTYECDDDKLFEILNSKPIIDIAKELVKEGKLDKAALEYRVDNPKTVIDESKFTHLNNFKEVLVVLGNYITKEVFLFKEEYLSVDEIKKSIMEDMPVIISAKFTSGGHFVTLVGYDDANNYVVDDPYGDWNKSYSSETLGRGKKLSYDIKKLSNAVTFKKLVDGVEKYQIIRIYSNFEKK